MKKNRRHDSIICGKDCVQSVEKQLWSNRADAFCVGIFHSIIVIIIIGIRDASPYHFVCF